MSKIVHLAGSYIDDFSYQVNLLPKAQVALGHDVTVIAPLAVRAPYYSMEREDFVKTEPYWLDGVKVFRLPDRFGWRNGKFLVMRDLYRHIAQEEPDLLFCHGLQRTFAVTACRYKEQFPQCCVVVDAHSDEYNSATTWLSKTVLHRGIWRAVARRVERVCDRIYYVAPTVKTFIQNTYGLTEEKLAPTYLGGDVSKLERIDAESTRASLRARLSIGKDGFLIVTAGKIDPMKKTHLLLQAINRLRDLAISVAVVGSVDGEYEKTLLDDRAGNSRIHLIGKVSSDEILEYFLAADLAVFPRSQSVLWQQAICCGLPCIFGYYPGGEYLNPGGNAKFLYSEDVAELAQMIRLLNDNPGELERMRDGALRQGVERFDYRRIAQEIAGFAEEFQQRRCTRGT